MNAYAGLTAAMFYHLVERRLSQATSRDDNDCILIARCKEGSREAFEILLRRYRERVLNLAFSILHSRDDAEDAAQEAFTQAFGSIATFRNESQFWTWLYRITLNICLHRKRRLKSYENVDNHEPENSTNAQQEAEARLMVESALNALPVPLREVLVLREMHDLSYEEIARVLNIPVGTVRSRLSEARRKFKDAWQEDEG